MARRVSGWDVVRTGCVPWTHLPQGAFRSGESGEGIHRTARIFEYFGVVTLSPPLMRDILVLDFHERRGPGKEIARAAAVSLPSEAK